MRLRLFQAFAVPVGLLLVALILIVSGAFAQFPATGRAVLWFFGLALLIVTFTRGILRYKQPSKIEARKRLDESHPDRPISALADRPVVSGPDTRRYWDRHTSYLLGTLRSLNAPRFPAEWKKADPFYLRFIVPVLLVGFVALNYSTASDRLKVAAGTDLGALFGADEMQITAWLTPPDHTGEAPVFLSSDTPTADIPTGSVLTVRVNGPGKPHLRRKAIQDTKLKGKKRFGLTKTEDGAWQIELPIQSPQRVTLNYWGERARWELSTNPDLPPEIRFDSEPEIGENDALAFEWSAEDDYGIASVNLVVEPEPEAEMPEGETDRVAIDLPVALTRSTQDKAALDMTRHKWAGLPVTLKLEARDAAGKVGVSDPVSMILPEKLFLEPLARASQEVRLDVLRESDEFVPREDTMAARLYDNAGLGDRLERAPQGVQSAALKLDALTYKPEFFYDDLTIYFGFRRAHEILRFARTTDDVQPIDDLLWSVALRAEFGTVADAARRLNAAREALERALRDGASEDEIRRLMEAFRNAAEDYIAAKMAEAMMNGGEGGEAPEGGQPPNDMLGNTDLADMLEALEDLTETGATDAARQLLSDVTNLLNNLEFQSGGGGGGEFGQQQDGEESDDSDAPPEEQRLQRALDRLAEILEEQRRLNDETLQERFGSDDGSQQDGGEQQGGDQQGGQQGGQQQGQSGMPNMPGGQQPGQSGQDPNGTPGMGQGGNMGDMLADRQSDLLEELEGYLADENAEGEGGMGREGEDGEQLGEAEQALRNAENALRRGDLGAAQFFQDQAIQNMRDAFGQMSENLDDLRDARRGTGENAVSDPLGRTGASGAQQNDGDGVTVPDKADRQRARDILDQLRERLNNSSDPAEREYLQRLLDRFNGN